MDRDQTKAQLNFLKKNKWLPKPALLFCAGILFILSFISSFYFQVNPSVEYEQKRLQNHINRQEADFRDFLENSVLMRKLVQNRESLEEYQSIAKKEYGIFLFAESLSADAELFFWSNQKVLPQHAGYNAEDGEYFQQLANGYYLVIRRTIALQGMTNKVVAYAMVPVLYQFDFQHSSYLRTHFEYDKDAINKIIISPERTDYRIRSLSKKVLFYIDRTTYTPIRQHDTITAFLRIIALIILLAYVHFLAVSFTKKI